MLESSKDNIKVMIRVRPLSEKEISEETHLCLRYNDQDVNMLTLESKPEARSFRFDWIGSQNCSQEQVFLMAGLPLVESCLQGYNATIFCYGQTGSGKTYTMQGRGGIEKNYLDNPETGLQPRVLQKIFVKMLEEAKSKTPRDFLVKCSYLEIYNENIIDLLNPGQHPLMLREDINKGVHVEGIVEEIVTTLEQALSFVQKGTRNRHIGCTNMNQHSSRSHSVFSLCIESRKSVNGLLNMKNSKFHFVDLAGSERQKQTASSGDRLKEAGNINKSLTVLGAVINSLVEAAEGKKSHIRYRDSKLTFLLRDSLGGNSKTCIIGNVSPSSAAFSETLSTSKFAQRAKMIKNKALVNEDSSGSVEFLKKELKRLKYELSLQKSNIQQEYLPNIDENLNSEQNIKSRLQGFLERSYELENIIQTNLKNFNTLVEKSIDGYNREWVDKALKQCLENELKMRTIIKLYESKCARSDIEYCMELEGNVALKELQGLKDALNNSPYLASLILENYQLKQKMFDSSQINIPSLENLLKDLIDIRIKLLYELKLYMTHGSGACYQSNQDEIQHLKQNMCNLKCENEQLMVQILALSEQSKFQKEILMKERENYERRIEEIKSFQRDFCSNSTEDLMLETATNLKIVELTDAMLSLKAKINDLELEKDELKCEIKNMTFYYEEKLKLYGDNENKIKNFDRIAENLTREEVKGHHLQVSFQNLQNEYLITKNHLEKLELELEDKLNSLDMVKCEKTHLQEELDTAQASLAYTQEEYKESMDNFNLQKEKWMSENLKNRRELDNLKALMESQSNELITNSMEEKNLLKRLLNEANEKLDVAMRNCVDMHFKLDESNEKMFKLKDERDNYKVCYDDNMYQLLELKNNLSETEEIINQKKIEIADLNENIKTLTDENSTLHKHMEDLTEALKHHANEKDAIEKAHHALVDQMQDENNKLNLKMVEMKGEINEIHLLCDSLKQANQGLSHEMKEKDEIMLRQKEQIKLVKEEVDNKLKMFRSIKELQEENIQLKSTIEEIKEQLNDVKEHAKKYLDNHLAEIEKMNEQYQQLEDSYQSAVAAMDAKDYELQRTKEDYSESVCERDKLLIEIMNYRISENQFTSVKRDQEQKINFLESENNDLKNQVINLSDELAALAGSQNHEQKIKHLNRLKEENTKLKEERSQLAFKNNQLQILIEKLSKTKKNSNELEESSEFNCHNNILYLELERKLNENKILIEGISKMNYLMNKVSSLFGEDDDFQKKSVEENKILVDPPAKYSLDEVTKNLEKMLVRLDKKEKELVQKERVLNGKSFKLSLVEKENQILKGKISVGNYKLNNDDADIENKIQEPLLEKRIKLN